MQAGARPLRFHYYNDHGPHLGPTIQCFGRFIDYFIDISQEAYCLTILLLIEILDYLNVPWKHHHASPFETEHNSQRCVG